MVGVVILLLLIMVVGIGTVILVDIQLSQMRWRSFHDRDTWQPFAMVTPAIAVVIIVLIVIVGPPLLERWGS